MTEPLDDTSAALVMELPTDLPEDDPQDIDEDGTDLPPDEGEPQ